MSTQVNSFRSIIELWPSPAAANMAAEIGAKVSRVRKWSQRDSIPSEWWASIVATDRAKGAGVTADLLLALDARERAEVRV